MPLDNFIRDTLALLAVLVAFYTLVARERKTPYIVGFLDPAVIAFIFSIFFFVLENFFTSKKDLLFIKVRQVEIHYSDVAGWWSFFSLVSFVIAFFLAIYGILRIKNRLSNFRDDKLVSNSRLVRWLKGVRRTNQKTKDYEHNPTIFSKSLLRVIEPLCGYKIAENLKKIDHEKLNCSFSVLNLPMPGPEIDSRTLKITLRFLEQGMCVQYVTCVRHPAEFFYLVKRSWKGREPWEKVSERIVLIDGYTPHFGFGDSIHQELTKQLKKEENATVISSKASFAGVHSAAAKAFNITKEKAKTRHRDPALVIYEGLYALTDLESIEQYRIFIRHVIPSERRWGGMLTWVVELAIDENVISVVKTCVDVVIDQRKIK